MSSHSKYGGLIWPLLLATGIVFWIVTGASPQDAHTWRMLLVNFTFWTPLAAGWVVWPAIVQLSRGRWLGTLESSAFSALGFMPFGFLSLLVLWMSAGAWLPWHDSGLPQGRWLDANLVFSRDIVALLLFCIAAWWYVMRRRAGSGLFSAGVLIAVYGITFSLLGFDLVMALDPHWYSSLFGAYCFTSGTYAALCLWSLIAASRTDVSRKQRADLGKLVLSFALFTGYLLYSQLLPIWYENLPAETRYLIPRLNSSGWQLMTAVVLLGGYILPLLLLLGHGAKRNRLVLGMASLAALVCLWVEKWWMVSAWFETDPVWHWGDTWLLLTFIGAMGSALAWTSIQLPEAAQTAEAAA